MYTGIIDVSHWEFDRLGGKIDDALQAAKAGGIGCVIVKATQGKDYVDPTFARWVVAVQKAGLMLGLYHFGSDTAEGTTQAGWFLDHASGVFGGVIPPNVRLVLDWETNPKGAHTMPYHAARDFLDACASSSTLKPILYSGSSFLCARVTSPDDPLGDFPLWVAAYGPVTPRVPPSCHVTLFQYTDGKFGPNDQSTFPRITPGFGGIDRSSFDGTAAEFAAWWNGQSE